MAFDTMFGVIDCDTTLFELLNGSDELKNAISGGIYTMAERPDGSELEDVVISTPSISQTKPQRGYSNVNIYVLDLKVSINNKEQHKANRERLKTIRDIVYSILKNANLPNLEVDTRDEIPIKVETVNQHYLNIRLYWFIC